MKFRETIATKNCVHFKRLGCGDRAPAAVLLRPAQPIRRLHQPTEQKRSRVSL